MATINVENVHFCVTMICAICTSIWAKIVCVLPAGNIRGTPKNLKNLREITLSLSCPEVAKIVMNTTEPITFVTKEDETDECYEEFDYFLFSELEDVREEMIRIIQDRNVNIRDRIDKILQISVSVQRHYDAGSLISWNEFEESDRVCVENEYELFERLFLFLFEEFEILYPQWAEVLVESRLFLFGEGKKVFEQNKEEFETWWNTSNLTPLDIVLEQLVVYFISVYLLGAVYDENILGKVDAASATPLRFTCFSWGGG